jgi:hypothetical protein
MSYIAHTSPSLHTQIRSLDNPPNLEKALNGGYTLKLAGVYIESRFDPEKENRAFERYGGAGFFVFLGAGLGYHLNHLLEEGTAGVLVEKSLEIFRASLFIILPEVLQRLRLFIGIDADAMSGEIGVFLSRDVVVVPHRRSIQVNERYYEKITRLMKDRINETEASRRTDMRTRVLWLKNVLKNAVLKRTIYASKDLLVRFQGPAVLIASGPYLEEVRGRLQGLARKLPVFALLPSVPCLLYWGIRPDFVVSTDAGFYNRYRLFAALRLMQEACPSRENGHDHAASWIKDIPLIAALSADSSLIRLWPGDVYVFSHGLTIENQLKRTSAHLSTVPMQGTAAIVMILVARMMGFSPIYLAGYDFAVQGLKNHHRGAGFDDVLEMWISRFLTRETVAADRLRRSFPRIAQDSTGSRIYTTHTLMLYRNWLERDVDLRDTARLNRGLPVRGVGSLGGEPDPSEWKRSFPEKAALKPQDIAEDLEELRRRISRYRDGNTSSGKQAQMMYRLFYGDIPPGAATEQIERDVSSAVSLLQRL